MAVRSTAAYKALYGLGGTTFADNTTGDIGADDVQQCGEDTADSFLSAVDDVLDEDDMASDSATKVPTQQSTKAYVDSRVGGGAIDTYSRIFEDFDAGPVGYLDLSAFNNGGGLGGTPGTSTLGVDNTEHANGVLQFFTSTSTAGGAALRNTVYQLTFGFGFTHTISFRAAISAASDGTDTFTVRLGFLDSHTGAPVDGAYFRYTHSVNSGRWQAVTVSNSVETAEDTGVSPTANTYQVFKIVANSTGTQVDFYIDGTLTNDITTNVINSSARVTGQVATIEKTAGSTSRILYIDYYEKITQRSTAR